MGSTNLTMQLGVYFLALFSPGILSVSHAAKCYKLMHGDGECLEPLSQGPCKEDEWLVLGSNATLECERRECDHEEVMIGGTCVHIEDRDVCIESEAIFLDAKGKPSCQCKDGWGRNPSLQTIKGRCFQEFTKGFCSGNFLLQFTEKDVLGCAENPCGNSTVTVPHFSTWNSLSDHTCHYIMTYQKDPEDNESEILPEDISECEVVVDTTWYHLATCAHLVQPPSNYSSSASAYSGYNPPSINGYAYLPPGTLGKNTCTRRQVWSKYRNKCIRSYKRY